MEHKYNKFMLGALGMLSLLLPFSAAAFIVGSSVAYRTRPYSRSVCDRPTFWAVNCDDEYDATTAVVPHLGRGLLRGVDLAIDNFYANEIDMSDEGLAWLNQPGLMWEAAMKDADEKGVPVEQYVDDVKANIEAFLPSGIVYDRKELLGYLDNAFSAKGAFSLLLGGRNVGKSTILENLATVYNDSSDFLVLYVDARLCPGRLEDGLANAVAQLVAETFFRIPDKTNLIELVRNGVDFGRAAAVQYALSSLDKDKMGNGNDVFISKILGSIFDSLLGPTSGEMAKVSQTLVAQFIGIAKSQNKFPVLVIDEANAVLGIENNGDPDKQTKNILTSLVSHTKQEHELNVILASSEHAYPYRLAREGFSLATVEQRIFAGEIPPKDMWKLLVNATYKEDDKKNKGMLVGMGPHLAELCLSAYGGHIWTVKRAINGLSIKQTQSTPSLYLPDLRRNIRKCLKTDPNSRPLLEAMAKYGFAPFETESEADSEAELISEENVGGVVTKLAACIGIADAKWEETEFEDAIIPASQCVRLKIAMVLDTYEVATVHDTRGPLLLG